MKSIHLPSEERYTEAGLVLTSYAITRPSSLNLVTLWTSTVTLVGVYCHPPLRVWAGFDEVFGNCIFKGQ